MTKYAWCTDVHLDRLPDVPRELIEFARSLIKDDPTGIFITGDITIARKLVYHLSALEQIVQRPIYFVLGNHDYHGADTEQVRKAMKELSNSSQFLRYMPTMPYYTLSPSTALVGHDGWYDALYGDWQASNFGLTDWSLVGDFLQVNGNKASIVGLARKLAHEAASHVHDGIKKAIKHHNKIIVLTHYPPFAEAHVHQGKQGEARAVPWYTSKFMGDVLLDASKAFPHVQFTVLCGHTHGKTTYQPTTNLIVHVGAAEYGAPALQGLIEVV